MKMIRQMLTNAFCTFTVLSVLFGILCRIGVLQSLPYDEVVFTLLFMSVGATAFVAARERVLPRLERAGHALDLVGCCAVILLIGWLAGWLEISLSYFLLILGMVLIVYLMVWFLTWLQSKHDEEDLNRLLAEQSNRSEDLGK